MADIEPVESGDRGVSIWTLVALAIGGVALLALLIWLLVRSVTGEDTASESVATTPAQTSTTAAPPTITGTFVIESDFDSSTVVLYRPGGELVEGTPCAGALGRIEPGTRMTVTDADGTLLGTGAIGEGTLVLVSNVDDYTVPQGSSSHRKSHVYEVSDCALAFSIPLTTEAEFYTIAVGELDGDSDSRLLTYSHLELASYGWILEITP